jgi:peptidoglycan/xylan/chitin deacetylase (PgdA/CDA1 family)
MTVFPASHGPPGGRVFNVTFHGVGPRSHAIDDGEAAVWVSSAECEAVLDAVAGRADVAISFDDGNVSYIEVALPRLVDRGLRARFFVLAGLLDQPGRLAESAVVDLQSAGMSIGSHGWSHRSWRGMADDVATQEIRLAKERLEDLCQAPVTTAAIPFGSYDRATLRRLHAVGMTRVFTSDQGPANPRSWLQARNSVHAGDTPADVRRLIERPESPLTWGARRTKRLVKRWR